MAHLAAETERKASREDEELLVARLRAGDHQAFESIFRLHSNKVFQLAYKLTRDETESEEVVQDVFLTVYQKARGFRGGAQFSTWLYRLTVNAALTRLRKKKRSHEVGYEDFLPRFQSDGHHEARPVVDWSNEVEAHSSSQELKDLLSRALGQLRPQDKAIIVLSDVEGFSDREIGKSLGLSVATVKTRLHRARLFLRGQLAVSLGHSAA